MVEQSNEKSTKEKIIDLLRKGYTRSQLIGDLEFAERTVDSAIKEYREIHGDDPGDQSEANGHDPRGLALQGGGKGNSALIRKQSEAVLPEWLQTAVSELFDGSEEQKRIFLAGSAVPIMGLRIFCESVVPIVQLLSVWQKGQAEAALAAQQSGSELARAAAEQAAMGIGQKVVQAMKQQAVAQSPNPMMEMMVDAIRPQFTQLMGNLMGSLVSGKTQPGQGTPLPMQSRQNGGQASAEEIEEVFRNGR